MNDLLELRMGYTAGLSIDHQYLIDIRAIERLLEHTFAYHTGGPCYYCFYFHFILGVKRQQIFD
jgi:hypothetical protein